MIFLVILGLILILLIYLLFVPIEILIDTQNSQYWIKFGGLMKVSFEWDEKHVIRGKLILFFRKFYFFPMSFDKPSKKSKTSDTRTFNLSIRKLLGLIKTFKVQKIKMNVDSGDFILNAYSVPLFSFLNHRFGGFSINNFGVNYLVLKLQNRPIYLIRTLFF